MRPGICGGLTRVYLELRKDILGGETAVRTDELGFASGEMRMPRGELVTTAAVRAIAAVT